MFYQLSAVSVLQGDVFINKSNSWEKWRKDKKGSCTVEIPPLHSSETELSYLASRAMVFSFFPVPPPVQHISLEWQTCGYRSQLRHSSSKEGLQCAVFVWSCCNKVDLWTPVKHTAAASRAHTSLCSHRHLVPASVTVLYPIPCLQHSQLCLEKITHCRIHWDC